jgi:DNA-binding CsgD family transcriptional regulator
MEWTARVRFTARQKAELWERWKNGQCVADIARALGRRNKSGVYRILAHDGGIVPLPRRRAAGALRLEERKEISRGIAAGRSIRRIARDLGRSPSTVSREIGRNGGNQGYRASWADGRAWHATGSVKTRTNNDVETIEHSLRRWGSSGATLSLPPACSNSGLPAMQPHGNARQNQLSLCVKHVKLFYHLKLLARSFPQ